MTDDTTITKVTRGVVPGAPFQIDNRVQVVERCDDAADATMLRKIGRVVRLDFDECGASYPSDPMILLRFRDGREDHFWHEELE